MLSTTSKMRVPAIAISPSVGDFHSAISQHADTQEAQSDIQLDIRAEFSLARKRNDKPHAFPQSVVRERSLRVFGPQKTIQCWRKE